MNARRNLWTASQSSLEHMLAFFLLHMASFTNFHCHSKIHESSSNFIDSVSGFMRRQTLLYCSRIAGHRSPQLFAKLTLFFLQCFTKSKSITVFTKTSKKYRCMGSGVVFPNQSSKWAAVDTSWWECFRCYQDSHWLQTECPALHSVAWNGFLDIYVRVYCLWGTRLHHTTRTLE